MPNERYCALIVRDCAGIFLMSPQMMDENKDMALKYVCQSGCEILHALERRDDEDEIDFLLRAHGVCEEERQKAAATKVEQT